MLVELFALGFKFAVVEGDLVQEVRGAAVQGRGGTQSTCEGEQVQDQVTTLQLREASVRLNRMLRNNALHFGDHLGVLLMDVNQLSSGCILTCIHGCDRHPSTLKRCAGSTTRSLRTRSLAGE